MVNFFSHFLHGSSPLTDQTEVYGMVMDRHRTKGSIGLFCSSTDDTSMYTSTVGGMIGSGSHDAVKTDAEEFVQKAQVYLNGPSKWE